MLHIDPYPVEDEWHALRLFLYHVQMASTFFELIPHEDRADIETRLMGSMHDIHAQPAIAWLRALWAAYDAFETSPTNEN